MVDAAKKIDTSVDEERPQALDESVKPVGVNRIQLADQMRNHYCVNCRVETKPENVLDPMFWEHIANILTRGDWVTVIPDNMTWECSVVVLDKGNNWALVRQRYLYDLGEPFDPSAKKSSEYEVEWAGTTDKYRVKYKGRVLKAGLATEGLANRYISNHAGALAR